MRRVCVVAAVLIWAAEFALSQVPPAPNTDPPLFPKTDGYTWLYISPQHGGRVAPYTPPQNWIAFHPPGVPYPHHYFSDSDALLPMWLSPQDYQQFAPQLALVRPVTNAPNVGFWWAWGGPFYYVSFIPLIRHYPEEDVVWVNAAIAKILSDYYRYRNLFPTPKLAELWLRKSLFWGMLGVYQNWAVAAAQRDYINAIQRFGWGW